MPLMNAQALTLVPAGVSDTLDGTNAFPGAMSALTDLVPAPGNAGVFVPRPASTLLTDFPGFANPGQVTTLGVFSGRVYGLLATDRFPGREEPFIYDLDTEAFVPITGVSSGNCPIALPTTGDWVPPVIAPVSASRIVVTHVGFPGGAGPAFGWFDTSGFTLNSLKGNVVNGSAIIYGINDGATSAPILDGVQPGQLITGAGIPPGATVVAATNGTFSLNTTGDTHTNTTLDNLASTTGVIPGLTVAGPQFAAGTYVVSVDSSTQVTLSTAALGSAAGTAVDFGGGGTITLSAPATASHTQEALSIAGGTIAAPLWAAGNTNGNPLPGVPVSVAQFNGRAYYAVLNSLVFSDSLNPTQVTNATQALSLDGKEPVTALAGQPLSSQVTGGIVQALLAFKGADIVYQITGDAATSDLRSQAINGSVGTLAPGTLCATPNGTGYISPDGLRFIGLGGTVGPPVGAYGQGVAQPFVLSVTPSRMAAAYNQNVYRVAFQNVSSGDLALQEYWLDLVTQRWTGPHSFPASVIQPVSQSGLIGFVLASALNPGSLWFSSAVPTLESGYVENGQDMTWAYETILLPDNGQVAMNTCIQALNTIAVPYNTPITYEVYDDQGVLLDSIVKKLPVNPALWGRAFWGVGRWTPSGSGTVWGGFLWGGARWGVPVSRLRQHTLPWTKPLVFKQASVKVTGASSAGVAISNLYFKYRVLGYADYEDN